MIRDCVCHMEVTEKTAPAWSVYKGQVYYFCCNACKIAFDKDPEHYLRGTPRGTVPR